MVSLKTFLVRYYVEQALAIQRELLGEGHPDTAKSLNNLGYLLDSMGEYEAARPYYEQALAIKRAEHPHTALSLNNLGYLLRTMGNYEAARPYFEKALAILEATLGAEHPNTKVVRGNLETLGNQSHFKFGNGLTKIKKLVLGLLFKK